MIYILYIYIYIYIYISFIFVWFYWFLPDIYMILQDCYILLQGILHFCRRFFIFARYSLDLQGILGFCRVFFVFAGAGPRTGTGLLGRKTWIAHDMHMEIICVTSMYFTFFSCWSQAILIMVSDFGCFFVSLIYECSEGSCIPIVAQEFTMANPLYSFWLFAHFHRWRSTAVENRRLLKGVYTVEIGK